MLVCLFSTKMGGLVIFAVEEETHEEAQEEAQKDEAEIQVVCYRAQREDSSFIVHDNT